MERICGGDAVDDAAARAMTGAAAFSGGVGLGIGVSGPTASINNSAVGGFFQMVTGTLAFYGLMLLGVGSTPSSSPTIVSWKTGTF